jgi:hypothetical protein
MKNSVNPKAEIALSISLIIFSAVVYYFSLELPDPVYEPLGSAALPKGLAVIMSLLSLIILVRAIPKIKTYKATTNTGHNVTSRPRTRYSYIYNYFNFYRYFRFWYLRIFASRNNLLINNRILYDPQKFEKVSMGNSFFSYFNSL